MNELLYALAVALVSALLRWLEKRADRKTYQRANEVAKAFYKSRNKQHLQELLDLASHYERTEVSTMSIYKDRIARLRLRLKEILDKEATDDNPPE